jgi:endonuclease-8
VPEGDTVWRTARRLDQALAGERLTASDLRWPSLATRDLSGMTTLAVVSRGKHLLHRLDSGLTLHSHLRMEGQWRIEPTEGLTSRHLAGPDLRAVLSATRWTALGRRLGMLDLVPTDREADLVGHLGPDLLGPDWDPDRAAANLSAADGPIGAALLDQRNLAGLGTLWVSEALFLERLNPWLPASDLSAEAVAALVDRAHRLIDAARHHAVQTSTGIRRAGENVYVHARSGRPCRRCGTTVRVAPIGEPTRERAMFSCPTCQGGYAPTDDRRPQQPLGSSRGSSGGELRPRRPRPGMPRARGG